MARSSETMSIYEAKNMLGERLTCPGCSNILVEPRVLSCMHILCYNCIEGLEVQELDGTTVGDAEEEGGEGNNIINCSICETPTDYPEGGSAALQPAFHLIAMLDLYKMVHKVQKGDKTSCENCKEHCAVGFCKNCSQLLCRNCITLHRRWSQFEKHEILGIEQIANVALQGLPLKEPVEMPCPVHDEPMIFFCNTCEHIICQSCTLNDHRDHDFQLVSEEFPQHEEDVRSALEPLKEQITKLSETIAEINMRETEIVQLGNELITYEQKSTQGIIEIIKESEDSFLSGVQSRVQEKMNVLAQQKAELDSVLSDLRRCDSYIEEELRIASPQQILINKSQMIESIKKIEQKSIIDDVQPKEAADISMASIDELQEKCQVIAKVGSAQITGIQVLDQSGEAVGAVGKEVCFNIRVKTDPLGFLVIPDSLTCSFSCAADGEGEVECTVDELAPAKYQVRYTPPNEFSRQLKVTVDGIRYEIPFTVHVARVPDLKEKLGTGITKPWGVCIGRSNEVIATDFEGHQVTIFDSQGGCIRKLGSRGKGKGQFKSPAGVAINQQNQIIVVESGNHRVQVISEHGDFINYVGGNGSKPLQFSFPYDVAVSNSGMIYVSDSYNHRIQVLNPDLTFAGSFGAEGSNPGLLKNPIGIAIGRDNKVYIADSGNGRVQVFSLAGDFERQFGTGELTIPSGVAIGANNVVYVTDTGIGQVAMFDSAGNFLGNYMSKSEEVVLGRPTGITIGSGNVIYVGDWGANDIVTLY